MSFSQALRGLFPIWFCLGGVALIILFHSSCFENLISLGLMFSFCLLKDFLLSVKFNICVRKLYHCSSFGVGMFNVFVVSGLC